MSSLIDLHLKTHESLICRFVRFEEHHARAKQLRDQQFDLFRTRLGGRLLHTHADHDGHLRANGAAAAQKGPFPAAEARKRARTADVSSARRSIP